jgi:branched-chain amino acid aminotransferase
MSTDWAPSPVLILGASPDCAAVVEYEGRPVGDGEQGPVAKMLRELIRRDIYDTGVPVPGLPQGKKS